MNTRYMERLDSSVCVRSPGVDEKAGVRGGRVEDVSDVLAGLSYLVPNHGRRGTQGGDWKFISSDRSTVLIRYLEVRG